MQWLASADAKPTERDPTTAPPAGTPPPPAARRLQRLKLSNYRLSGDREILFAPSSVHLVHGPNGSGKSSIVEALELLSCNRIERLDLAGEKNYERIVTNRDAKNSNPSATATITRVSGDNTMVEHRVVPNGLDPLGPRSIGP